MDEWIRSGDHHATDAESRITELVGLGALALEGVGEEISQQLRNSIDALVDEIRRRVAADVDREVARARAEISALMRSVDVTLAAWHDRLEVDSAALESAVGSLVGHLGAAGHNGAPNPGPEAHR